MLLRPSVAAYRQCDVRTKTQHNAFWKHLPSQEGWLYSLESPENVHILCPGLEEITKIITGTGVLYLSANCMGRTGSTTLTGIRTYDNKNQFFYTRQVNLNITLLIPDLNNTLKEIKESGVRFKEPDKRVDFGKPWENGKSLFELESKIQEIGKHRRNKHHEENLIIRSPRNRRHSNMYILLQRKNRKNPHADKNRMQKKTKEIIRNYYNARNYSRPISTV